MTADAQIAELRKTLKQKGDPAMRNVRRKLLTIKDDTIPSQALRYFAEVTLKKPLPVFPALISISCEAVGGNSKLTIPFGEAIVMISAAADLHDDVIDHSIFKHGKPTVLGKFGEGTTILSGDILLIKGYEVLIEAGEAISKEQSRLITKLVSDAVSEICTAEATEIQFHGKAYPTVSEYHEIIRLKAVVPEIASKIGAIIGNGSTAEVDELGRIGRNYGINSVIIEEFADLLDAEELRNRIKNECLPLPVVYAFQNQQIKDDMQKFLNNDFTRKRHHAFVNTILESNEVKNLENYVITNAKNQAKQLTRIKVEKIREELENLLLVPLKIF
jgi:geranylgeranyl diphosphate synthase type II